MTRNMATKTNNQKEEHVRAAEILEETAVVKEADEDAPKSKTERALLAPRYLVPTFTDENESALSRTKLAAIIATGVILVALIGLYIYGATIV